MSLCPLCYGLPVRMTKGSVADMSQYGIHNGARGEIIGWTLHAEDEAWVAQCKDAELILKHLPTRIILKMENRMTKKHPDLPEQHYILKPGAVEWSLDGRFGQDAVILRRRGYTMVPNFSTTIDGATGKTMEKAIADLGSWDDVATFTRSMKGYIALSRVTKAHDLLLAQTFNPGLFQLGAQPWPNLLLSMETGHGEGMSEEALNDLFTETDRRSNIQKKLFDMTFECEACQQMYLPDHFGFRRTGDEWRPGFLANIIQKGCRRSCKHQSITISQPTHKCQECKQSKTEAMFSASMWNNKAKTTRSILCLVCEQARQKTQQCKLCKEFKMQNAFSQSMWENARHADHQRTLCLDCVFPACTSKRCKACPSCGAHHRKNGKCIEKAARETPNSKHLPKSMEDIRFWLCSTCRPKHCQNYPHCNRYWPRSEKLATCGDCQSLSQMPPPK